jgi:hypothetical protein
MAANNIMKCVAFIDQWCPIAAGNSEVACCHTHYGCKPMKIALNLQRLGVNRSQIQDCVTVARDLPHSFLGSTRGLEAAKRGRVTRAGFCDRRRVLDDERFG